MLYVDGDHWYTYLTAQGEFKVLQKNGYGRPVHASPKYLTTILRQAGGVND